MKEYAITAQVKVYDYNELPSDEQQLIDTARNATDSSYVPYSRFRVGAALQLEDGTVMPGCNQENAAYSLTLCAERSAIFAAGAQHPELAPVKLAIAARTEKGFTPTPTAPCGSCRQVILETECRYKRPIRILLFSQQGIHVVESIRELLPLQFTDENLGERQAVGE